MDELKVVIVLESRLGGEVCNLEMKQSQCGGGDLSDLMPGSERLKLS